LFLLVQRNHYTIVELFNKYYPQNTPILYSSPFFNLLPLPDENFDHTKKRTKKIFIVPYKISANQPLFSALPINT